MRKHSTEIVLRKSHTPFLHPCETQSSVDSIPAWALPSLCTFCSTWIILFDQMLPRGSQERRDRGSECNAERRVQRNADLLNSLNRRHQRTDVDNLLAVNCWVDSHGEYFNSLRHKQEKGLKWIIQIQSCKSFPTEGDNNPDMPQSHIFILTLRPVIHFISWVQFFSHNSWEFVQKQQGLHTNTTPSISLVCMASREWGRINVNTYMSYFGGKKNSNQKRDILNFWF